MKNLGIDNTKDDTVQALNVGDPGIGEVIWIDTDRFFYIGRFRGRSEDGNFWVLDRASMIIQMGVVTEASTEGSSALHEVHPFAVPFYAIRYTSVTGWRAYPHELPSKPISRSA